MRIHFFSETDLSYRPDFRTTYILQNLKTIKSVSLIYFIICLIFRIIIEVFKSSVLSVNHMDEYESANKISLFVTPVFFIGSIQIIRFFNEDKKYITFVQVFVFLFTLFVIINAMRATFYSMHNPRNTLVMYMLGLIITSVFFTFEYYETLILTIITGVCFIITLPFYLHEFDELLLNNLASFVLLAVFFAMSRFSFSYRADNYLKLKFIEEKNIEVENAIQVKNEILGVVAHDLRNPLAAIQTITLILEEDKNIDEENQGYLQIIKASCEKAVNIINDLLETANNDMSKNFELEATELNKFLSVIVDEWKNNKKDQVNILFYRAKQPVYALINKEKMQRAMDNLISNAVKFSGEADNIEILLKELNGEIFIDIKDFGVGIPADLLPYIFDRFSKASRKGIRGEESVGLGLSIVRQIIQKHGGEINVDSAEKQGTNFMIKLQAVAYR